MNMLYNLAPVDSKQWDRPAANYYFSFVVSFVSYQCVGEGNGTGEVRRRVE